jgi:hypothetical protein
LLIWSLMEKAAWAGIVLWLLVSFVPAPAGETMDSTKRILASLLPAEVQGWTAAGPDRLFDSQTIFDYLDGGGEVYRSYNFRLLLSRRYERAGAPAIVADVFDMGSAADAFGVFTHDLDGEPAGVGQDSNYKAGLLSFWKGRFFISLYAEEETEEAREAVLDLGRWAATAIPEEGKRPMLLNLVPEPFASEHRLHYFHTHPILNYHLFVAEENILELGERTEVVLARAGVKGARTYLLIAHYPEDALALGASQSFGKAIMGGAPDDGAQQMPDRTWTALRRRGAYVFIMFQAGTQEAALAAVEGVERLLDKTRS